jgi:hypothetical protein
MGFLGWAWKHSATRQLMKGPPKRKPAMTTVGGLTHRLIWADRNAGWRYRCSCGWIDAKIRWTENNATYEGNRHVRAARSGGDQRAAINAAAKAGVASIKAATAAMKVANDAMQSNSRLPSTDQKIAEALAAWDRVYTAIGNGEIFGETVSKCWLTIEAFEGGINAFYFPGSRRGGATYEASRVRLIANDPELAAARHAAAAKALSESLDPSKDEMRARYEASKARLLANDPDLAEAQRIAAAKASQKMTGQ